MLWKKWNKMANQGTTNLAAGRHRAHDDHINEDLWVTASWSKVSARCSGGLAWKRALVVFAPPKFGHRRRIACGSCRAAKSYCVMFDGCRSTEGAEERPWHKHKRQQTTTCCLGREGFSPTPCCQRRSSAAVSVDKEKSTGFDLTGNEWDASDRQTSELLFLCFLSSALSDTTAYSNEPLRNVCENTRSNREREREQIWQDVSSARRKSSIKTRTLSVWTARLRQAAPVCCLIRPVFSKVFIISAINLVSASSLKCASIKNKTQWFKYVD